MNVFYINIVRKIVYIGTHATKQAVDYLLCSADLETNKLAVGKRITLRRG